MQEQSVETIQLTYQPGFNPMNFWREITPQPKSSTLTLLGNGGNKPQKQTSSQYKHRCELYMHTWPQCKTIGGKTPTSKIITKPSPSLY